MKMARMWEIIQTKAEGIEAKGYVCDVTSEEQVNAMVTVSSCRSGARRTMS